MIVLHAFRALKTCTNQVFLDALWTKKDTWQEVKRYTLDKIKMFATKKYNNLVEQKVQGHFDPKDAHILALTTKVTGLEENMITKVAYYTPVDNAAGSLLGKHVPTINEWREHKGEAMIVKDGKI